MQAALIGPQGRQELGSTDITIGRTPDNTIVLINDGKVSGHHALIRPQGNGYCVIDTGSTNGTFVNEQRLERNVPRSLSSRDVVRVGDTRFTYEAAAPGIPPTVFAATEGEIPPTVMAPQPINSTVAAPNPFENRQAYPDVPVLPDYSNNRAAQWPPQLPQYPGQDGQFGQQPQKKSRRGLWITLSVVGVLLLVACAAIGIFALSSHSTPEQTLTTFCTDLKNSNYHDAYQQLSSNAQGRVSEQRFTQEVSAGFGQAGGLKDCVFSPNPVNKIDSNTADTSMLWTVAAISQPIPAQTRLIVEGGVWKIDAIKPQVQGAPSV